jgi:hypothetical protein
VLCRKTLYKNLLLGSYLLRLTHVLPIPFFHFSWGETQLLSQRFGFIVVIPPHPPFLLSYAAQYHDPNL